jgi:hypothetical protein
VSTRSHAFTSPLSHDIRAKLFWLFSTSAAVNTGNLKYVRHQDEQQEEDNPEEGYTFKGDPRSPIQHQVGPRRP